MSHDSIDTEIDFVHRHLSSSKVTQRKVRSYGRGAPFVHSGLSPSSLHPQEGLKKLNVLLDSNEFLQALDRNTLATPAAGKIKGPHKPGCCSPCHSLSASPEHLCNLGTCCSWDMAWPLCDLSRLCCN